MKQVIILLLPMLVFACSCESGNEPGKETKNPRDYTWSADTLQYEGSGQTIMNDIWASAKNNIFVCGYNSSFTGTLWRYNGTNWNMVDLFADIEMGPHILNEIHGFPGPYSYGVWIAGERLVSNDQGMLKGRKTMILYNDGVSWHEENIQLEGRMLTVDGDRPDNVWFGGDHGRVYHWDGSIWKNDIVSIPEFPNSEVTVDKIRISDGEVYLQARIDADIGYFYFIKGNIGNWEILDRMTVGIGSSSYHWGRTELFVSDWNKMYSCHWKIYEWNQGSWNILIDKTELTTSIDDIMGLEENNMFFVGWGGQAYHWNGTDIYQIPLLNNTTDMIYYGVWMFEDEVIIIGSNYNSAPQPTIVFTGN